MKDSNEARKAILQGTIEEIIELGIGNARTGSIAKRAGVTSGLLHYHFGTKDKLITMVIEMFFDTAIVDRLTVVPYYRQCSCIEKIHVILYALSEWFYKQENSGLFKFFFQLLANNDVLKPVIDEYDWFVEKYLVYLLKRGNDEGLFSVEYPEFFALDAIETMVFHLSMYEVIKGSAVGNELLSTTLKDKYKKHYIDIYIKKLLIPSSDFELKPIPEDLKNIVDTYINRIIQEQSFISWHVVIQVLIKIFGDTDYIEQSG